MEDELLKQYWNRLTDGDSHKITWDEASKNAEVISAVRKSIGFALFKATLAISNASRAISDRFASLVKSE